MKILSAAALALLLFSISACSSAGKLPENAQIALTHVDARAAKIGSYTSTPRGFETNSFWIEGPTGLILIDTQFLLSAGAEAADWAEKITGKKVKLAIVLHPNPDKFNGTAQLQKRGIQVVTSEQVLKLIPEVHKDRHHWFYKRYQPDYPNEEPKPESFGNKSIELTAGGVTVKAHVLEAGCSEAHVVIEYNGHIFTGDLVTNLHHAWLEIGKTDEWVKRIKELMALNPEFVHPGRGPSGGTELLTRQEIYLKKVIELVAAEKPKGPSSSPAADEALARVQKKMESLYPGYGNEYFVEIGLPAEWDRQVKKSQAK